MLGTTAAEIPSEVTGIGPVPLEATAIQTTTEPEESWSNEMLLGCGREAIQESDLLEAQAQPFLRQSINSRLRGGHALSILRARLKSEGRWLGFQQENALPRSTLWQMIEVYERATKDGYTAQDLVEDYGTWTGILLAYGLAQPRKGTGGGCTVEQIEPPAEDDDDADEVVIEKDLDEEGSDGESPEDETDEGESENESPDAEPEEAAEEEPPAVSEDQIIAADAFVIAVGGVPHAVRALVARSIMSGDKDAVKTVLTEVVRAARALLTPAEITEIVIVGAAAERGIKWVAV